MTPNFSDITYFIEVAQTGNISRAAERLGLSQPSLSSAMKRLEDSVGTPLLIRGRTGVQLTKAGVEFLGRGRLLLLNWEQLRIDVNQRMTELKGQYVLGCHPSVALYSLSHFLPRLIQDHPDLDIKLIHDLSRKITERVVSFEIDFGIVVNPVRHPDLVISELATDDVMFWAASKPSPTQNLDPNSSVLICDSNLTQVQKLLSQMEKRGQGFKRVIESSDLEVVTELTAAGTGVGIIPKRVATRSNTHRLKVLDSKLPVFKDRICLIHRADAQRGPASRALIQSIKSAIN